MAALPGASRPVLEVLTQYQATRLLDHYEARTGIGEGAVVIDGGAGYGTFTLLAAKLTGPQGRVMAVEPVAASLAALRATVRANNLTWVEVVAGALDRRPGATTIALPRGRYAEATACAERRPDDAEVDRFEVECVTIDDLVQKFGLPRVDFIKLNIEGMEEAALRGAAKTLRTFKPRLSLSLSHLDDDMQRLPAVVREIEPTCVVQLFRPASGLLPIMLAAPEGQWNHSDDSVRLQPDEAVL